MKPLQYLLYLPKDEAKPPYPLIIFLHGIGERGEDLQLVKKWGLPKYSESGEVELPAYVVAPQCPPGLRWGDCLDELDAMLDDLLAQHPLDADRVYLTGFSMGGFGTWQWASRSPHRFAALMPVGGSALADLVDMARMKDMPIWMVHSALDQSVLVNSADSVAAALARLGSKFGYTRYPDATHGQTSDRAFRDKTLLNWMLAQKREQSS